MDQQWQWVFKLLDLGGMGLCCFLLWRLLDKWAGKFLEVQMGQTGAMSAQATAMAQLATAVKDGQSDQREVLMAVRLLADRIDTQKGYLMQIEENCRKRCV
jgi:hypothetical protein